MPFVLRAIRFSAYLVPLVCFVVVLSGCGDGRPSRVKVSGQVTVDGEILKFGGVQFKPVGGGRSAGGPIGEGNLYTITMYKKNDGLPPGSYTVSVDAVEYINDHAQRWHAPKKYSDHATSGLTAEITEETSDMNFELTWDGDEHSKPWVEKQ